MLEANLPVDLTDTANACHSQSTDLALPAEMVEGVNTFKEFYEGETKHRRLAWIYTLGQAVLKARASVGYRIAP